MKSFSTNMTPHVNEFLCYITNVGRSGNNKFLINIIKAKIGDDDIKAGKQLLWRLRGDKLGTYPNRSWSINRPAIDAHIDDVIRCLIYSQKN